MSQRKNPAKFKEKSKKSRNNNDLIRDVYSDNFIEELKILSSYLNEYNIVAIDTEFPGVVYQSPANSMEAYYRTIKINVDKLKLIQVGISLKDEDGNSPQECSTWQFNLKFNLNNDQYSNDSIALLSNSGINFDLLENRGITAEIFAENIITSGLILNEDIYWISFHGIYDFAYLLKYVTNLPLPESEINFFEDMKVYFPNYYDIRYLIRHNDEFRGSLSKLGQELNISRVGTTHQAGSDSLITNEIFFKLKKDFLIEEALIIDRNILFGIGPGLEDNDINNTYNAYYGINTGNNNNNMIYKFNSNGSSNIQCIQSQNNINYDYNNYYNNSNMINNMNYNNGYLRGKNNNNNSGYYSSVNMSVYQYGNYNYQMSNNNNNNQSFNNNNTGSANASASASVSVSVSGSSIDEKRKYSQIIQSKINED
jgi:CCR4-NOT transcription complex subunit 7/8